MPLTTGTRLGPYEIVAPLGAGGMGEVYRARDTRLGRDVAIKVLPEAFARDAERLARFEREARTVASFNHPNIVVLHSIEEESGIRFLAMELVEGQTLDALIPADGLPTKDPGGFAWNFHPRFSRYKLTVGPQTFVPDPFKDGIDAWGGHLPGNTHGTVFRAWELKGKPEIIPSISDWSREKDLETERQKHWTRKLLDKISPF